MKFLLQIDSESSAFSGEAESNAEAGRLLREVADKIERGLDCGVLLDINGNRCGDWGLEHSELYRCDDCGSIASEDDDGTTCRECGRGIISEGT